MKIKILDVDTTEEYVMNQEALPEPLRGWRHHRVEYGGCNEDCLYEGRILLPPRADPLAVVQLLLGMQAYEEMWTET